MILIIYLNNNLQQINDILLKTFKEIKIFCYSRIVMETDTKSVPNSNYVYYPRRIGRGSFSKVYKGFNIVNGDIVAIKKIDLDMSANMINRLKMEVEIMKTLNHKHIVKLYDVFYDEYYAYLIMEYSHCGDLSKYLKGRPLKEKYAQKFAIQLSHAMKYLIERNIIHRDIKPQNILVFNKNTIKLTDFGFARYFDKGTMVETLCGSPLYMSPEIIKYKKYSHKADLWSIGVIFYELLTGRPPYNAKTHYELAKKIENNPIYLPKILPLSSECADLIHKLLQKDSNKRISWDNFFNHNWLNLKKANIITVLSTSNQSCVFTTNFETDDVKNERKLSNSFCDPNNLEEICNLQNSLNDNSSIQTFDDMDDTVLIKTTENYINIKTKLRTDYVSNCKIVNEMFTKPICGSPNINNGFIVVDPIETINLVEPIVKGSKNDPNARTIFSGLFGYMNRSVNYVKTYLKHIPNSD